MDRFIRLDAEVADIEARFGVTLHETCAREAFDTPLAYNGSTHPNMLIIIEGHRYLVTGIWGLVPEGLEVEQIPEFYKRSDNETTLYIPFNLYRSNRVANVQKCIVPATWFGAYDTEIQQKTPEIFAYAGIYRRTDYMTTFSILTAMDNTKLPVPIKINPENMEDWLDKGRIG